MSEVPLCRTPFKSENSLTDNLGFGGTCFFFFFFFFFFFITLEADTSSFSLTLSSLELSDTHV